jgi:hypothetical protein
MLVWAGPGAVDRFGTRLGIICAGDDIRGFGLVGY